MPPAKESNGSSQMAKTTLAILLSLAAMAPAAAQGQARVEAQAPTLRPAVDTPSQRLVLKNLASCIANIRPGWARSTLSHPYLSSAQANAAAVAVSGRDNCLGQNEVEVVFRTSGMVGSLAEHFVAADLERADLPAVSRTLARLEPRNASEDFALCLASRDPVAARDLAVSRIGSRQENEAATRVAEHLDFCTNPGEQLTVDLQSLRSLVATALYRGMTTEVAARD